MLHYHNRSADDLAEQRNGNEFNPDKQVYYSMNYKEFLKEQILIVFARDGTVSFLSRIERRVFLRTGSRPQLNEDTIDRICRTIHGSIRKFTALTK